MLTPRRPSRPSWRFLLIAVIALAAPAPAQAKLPSPKTTRIVPGKAIGGVKIGMRKAAARSAWGKGGKCARGTCTWKGTAKQGRAAFDLDAHHRIVDIFIQAGASPDGKTNFKTPLAKWQTSKHVRIGSTLGSIVRKYKKAKRTGDDVFLQAGNQNLFTQFNNANMGDRRYGKRVGTIELGPAAG